MTEYVRRNFKPTPKAALSTAIEKDLIEKLDKMAHADKRSRCAMASILLERAIKEAHPEDQQQLES